MIGVWQLVLILLIVLLLFGANRLPKIMGDIGRGIRNLKAGLRDEDLDTHKLNHKEEDEHKK